MRRFRDGLWLCVALVAVALLAWAGRARNGHAPPGREPIAAAASSVNWSEPLEINRIELGMTREAVRCIDGSKVPGSAQYQTDSSREWHCADSPLSRVTFEGGRVVRIEGDYVGQAGEPLVGQMASVQDVLRVLGQPAAQSTERLTFEENGQRVEIELGTEPVWDSPYGFLASRSGHLTRVTLSSTRQPRSPKPQPSPWLPLP